MQSKLKRLAVLFGLMSVSAVALASQACCGDLACCLQQLAACCF